MKRKQRVFAQIMHPFAFTVILGDGTKQTHLARAKVRKATRKVKIVLDEPHVQKAIDLRGAGSTTKCSVAICVLDHKEAFPHPVEGHVDWQYSRAFVATKTRNGFPCECVAYEHHTNMARVNDTPGGMQKLLDRIRKHGPIIIELSPYRERSIEGRPGRGRKGDGKRSPIRHGANRRRDVVVAGMEMFGAAQ